MSTPENFNSMISRRNPIIGHNPEDTLYRAACCLAALSRLHEDRADWAGLGDWPVVKNAGIPTPGVLSSDQERGLSILLDAVGAALLFECDGRQA